MKEKNVNKLDVIISDLNTKFKYDDKTIRRLDDDIIIDVDRFSTGSIVIDKLLDGGVPRGRITEIYGNESTGKTTLAIQTIMSAQREGYTCLYLDVENSLDIGYLRSLGIDSSKLYLIQSTYGEEVIEIAKRFIESGEIGVVVLDSVAAMTNRREAAGEMEDANMGVGAKLMSKAMRILPEPLRVANTAMICINQVRDNLTGYGGRVTPGGRALKFAATVRMDLRKISSNDKSMKVAVSLAKYKLGNPTKKAEATLVFGKGFVQEADMVDIGLDLKLWKRAGAWYKVGNESVAQGYDAMVDWLISLKENDNERYNDYIRRCIGE